MDKTSADIDWVMVLIKSSLTNYLDKYEALALSLTNKRIRAKLYPIIFSDLTINSNVLLSHFNYFEQEKYYRFDNLTYLEKFLLILNYGFSRELAFKQVQIDPFIEEAINTLNSASIHCKSLSLYFSWASGDDRASYFTFSIFENFYNLNKLTLDTCEIPFTKFSNLLAKLEILQELDMRDVNLILGVSESPSSSDNNLKFPKTLTKLIYQYIKFGITDFPEIRPLEFVRNVKRYYSNEDLNLLPQYLPNLKSLVFCNRDWDIGEFEKFLDMCPALEYVNRPITY
ncbi:hypothetical protein CONCODRAFT_80749 [Conidiobolus coronatus NRRL 28638]|uniref:F-box domain-containing protein n=1 Tax=Conidiobolus coronatus (strain ATCC 28846 / CBS 209.66 / NRRL 28638) TaxID=796925 RepID=A0A137NS58_CONC2|nr:hypothetical protein CONCODRAFT_80749 [Conidiobolus coronatus NRRL 28638]|eukprot:KXN65522.1 hypothetical protein CONCODRAFT_80749 [Conidiobolus coronatus NRRL 28638]